MLTFQMKQDFHKHRDDLKSWRNRTDGVWLSKRYHLNRITTIKMSISHICLYTQCFYFLCTCAILFLWSNSTNYCNALVLIICTLVRWFWCRPDKNCHLQWNSVWLIRHNFDCVSLIHILQQLCFFRRKASAGRLRTLKQGFDSKLKALLLETLNSAGLDGSQQNKRQMHLIRNIPG